MITPYNGGPAFPVPMIPIDRSGGYTSVEHEGMSLRDCFAGQENIDEVTITMATAQALAGCPPPDGQWNDNPLEWCKWESKWRAALKYIRADAMLAERERKVGE